MELIIKPTSRCNFNCNFCSAAYMNISDDPYNVPEVLKKYIIQTRPNSLIITGGEPLMMNPEYYYSLHDITGSNISITSNLKDFFINTNKWVEIFNEKWFNITTSFQYGCGRMWDYKTVYTEELFLKVMELFKKTVRKPLPVFIAVIDDNNENMAIDHVILAKNIGTKVRLNNMIGVGKGKSYPRYKIIKIYLDIINRGLEEYEINCLERFESKCPKSIGNTCEKHIRCAYVDNNDHLHIGVCDERVAYGDEFTSVDESINAMRSDYVLKKNEYINDDCIYCELFRLCNGCKMNRLSAIKDCNYCNEMIKLKNDIIEKGWML